MLTLFVVFVVAAGTPAFLAMLRYLCLGRVGEPIYIVLLAPPWCARRHINSRRPDFRRNRAGAWTFMSPSATSTSIRGCCQLLPPSLLTFDQILHIPWSCPRFFPRSYL